MIPAREPRGGRRCIDAINGGERKERVMPGAVRRMTVPLVVAAAVALVTALPAFAKGEDTRPVRITASVTGPGLAVPVVITWRGDCPFPEYCGLDVGRSGNQLDAY